MSGYVEALGLAAAGIGMVTFLPQAVRVVRLRSHEGVSGLSWALAVAAGLLWTSYSVQISSVALVVGNGLALAGSVVVLTALWVHGGRRLVPSAVVTGACLAAAVLLAFAPGALGWSAAGLSVATRLPQLWQSIRCSRGAALSAASWVLSAASAALWVVYGIAIDSGPVILTDAWALLAAVAIVLASRSRGRDEPALLPAG